MHGVAFFSASRLPVAVLWYSPLERGDPFLVIGFFWSGHYAHSLLDLFFARNWQNDFDVGILWTLPVVALNLPWLNITLTITQVFSPQMAPIVRTWFRLLAQRVYGLKPKIVQNNKFVENELENWVLVNQITEK